MGENIDNSFIPPYCRINCNFGAFTEIAIENYYIASDSFNNLIQSRLDCGDPGEIIDKICRHGAISIVFAAMAIEAFFNDYAASHIGDAEFYGKYDRKKTLWKFEWISKRILQADFDKGESYFGRLNQLLKQRNDLVHSKSKDSRGLISEDNINKISDLDIVDNSLSDRVLRKYKKWVTGAFNGIMAIKEIAEFFDKNDQHGCAVEMLFPIVSGKFIVGKDHPYARILRDLELTKKDRIKI